MSIIIWLPIAVMALWFTPRVFIKLSPQFGGSFTKAHKQAFERSRHWNGKVFENLTPVDMDVNLKTLPGLLKERFFNKTAKAPEQPIPIKPFDQDSWGSAPDLPKFIWYGHATLLLQIGGKNLLIDPMFGPSPSPLNFAGIKRFSKNTLDLIDQLPPIDAALISHDHYDHLDYKSIQKLKSKIPSWLVALGVGRHLEKWGVDPEKVTEFDWWQTTEFKGVKITFTPSQHFSGRGLSDRFKSFWGGWVLQNGKHNIYWSGDGGYGSHFKTVAEKFGPFDWAFMECGQYYDLWHDLHLFPEESVQAAIDSEAQIAIPVHWGAFALAMHAWKEPVERFTAAAKNKAQPICIPEPGEVVMLGQEPFKNDWYKTLT